MSDIVVKTLLITCVLMSFALPGFILRKKNLIQSDSAYTLSNILLCVCQPLLIVKSFAVDPIEPTGELLLSFLYSLLFALAVMLLTFFVAKLVFRLDKKTERKRKDIFTFVATFSNCGFLGIPFVEMFTDGNTQAVMYAIIFNAAFNLLVWTLGAYLITQDKKQISLRKALFNPCVVGVMIGFVLFVVPQINIFNMPSVKELQMILTYTGSMTAPLSMIIVGMRLAELSPRALFCDKGIYVSSALRLLVAPLIAYLVVLPFKLTGAFADNPYLLLAPVIAMAMPPAASVVAFAERLDGERECAAAAYSTGTLLSLITLPIVLTLVTL